MIGQVLDGRYQITRAIGTGGMGAVYEAHQQRLNRKVAIKTIHAHLATKAVVVERFRREAMAAASAGSQHIVDVYDLGVMSNGAPFMVMELIEGTDLRTMVERHGRLATTTAAHIIRQACDALEAAHEVGIIHRDMKPENIMITRRRNDANFVKVVDFGISKLRDSSLTGSHELLGTPYAMAPEQLRGAGHVDARCDIYGLGVCLYWALSSDVPYDAETLPLLIAHITSGQGVELQRRVQNLPQPAYDLVATAMAHDPAHRFRTPGAFASALRTLETSPDHAAALAATAHQSHVPAPATAPKPKAPQPTPPAIAPQRPAQQQTHATLLDEGLSVRARGTTIQTDTRLPTTFFSKVVRTVFVLAVVGGLVAAGVFGMQAWREHQATEESDAGVAQADALLPRSLRVTGLSGARVQSQDTFCTTPCTLNLAAAAESVHIGYEGHWLEHPVDADAELALGAARVSVRGASVEIGPHLCTEPCTVPLPVGRHAASAIRGSAAANTGFVVRAGEITSVLLMLPDDPSLDDRVDTGHVHFSLRGNPVSIRMGEDECTTPCIFTLPAGRHQAEAVFRNGRRSTRSFTVRAGETTHVPVGDTIEDMLLDALGESGTADIVNAVEQRGQLMLSGRHVRNFDVDGETCSLPCTMTLPEGSHRLHVTFEDGETLARPVRIRSGGTTRLLLQPARLVGTDSFDRR